MASCSETSSANGSPWSLDESQHIGVRLEQIGEDRNETVAEVLHRALADVEVEHGEKFSIRPGAGHHGLAAGIGDKNRPWHGVVGMPAQYGVDAGDPAGELEVDVHAVVRQQDHRIGVLRAA